MTGKTATRSAGSSRRIMGAASMAICLGILVVSGLHGAAAQAHYITEFWEAKVTDNACFVAARAENSDEDMAAIVSFVAPHPFSPNPYRIIDDFKPWPLYLNVQIQPAIRSRDELVVSKVVLNIGEDPLPLIPDPTWFEASMPVLLLDSEHAELVWLHMEVGGEVTLTVTLNDDQTVKVPVQDTQFSLAMAMHNTCVAELRSRSQEE